MSSKNQTATIYTILYVSSDTEDGDFIVSKSTGAYLTLDAARKELAKQIAARKEAIPANYDCEERGDNFWTMYQDGFAAAAYSKLEIVPTTLNLERSA